MKESVKMTFVEKVNHTDVFRKFNGGERGFVKDVFSLETINHMRSSCGLDPIAKEDIVGGVRYDSTVYPGGVAKYADILIEYGENLGMYVEVMDGSHPQWDGAHHEQYILKQYRLAKKYDRLETFAVSFDNYTASHLNDFNDDGTYAMVMKMTKDSEGYKFYFDCENSKATKSSTVRQKYETPSSIVDSLNEWIKALEAEGRKPSVHPIEYSYLPVNNGEGGKKTNTVQLKAMDRRNDNLGIKLHGAMYLKSEYSFITENKDQIATELSEKTGFDVTHNGAASDAVFWLNISHLAYDRASDVENAIKEFCKICGIS